MAPTGEKLLVKILSDNSTTKKLIEHSIWMGVLDK